MWGELKNAKRFVIRLMPRDRQLLDRLATAEEDRNKASWLIRRLIHQEAARRGITDESSAAVR